MNRFIDEFNPQPSDVTICGSMTHKDRWMKIIEILQQGGLVVAAPDLSESSDWSGLGEREIVQRKGWFVRRHIANIANTKAVLIANFSKNGIENYIGSNSFPEMAAAFMYDKPIYLLNGIPEQHGREEILALEPVVLGGDVQRLLADIETRQKTGVIK